MSILLINPIGHRYLIELQEFLCSGTTGDGNGEGTLAIDIAALRPLTHRQLELTHLTLVVLRRLQCGIEAFDPGAILKTDALRGPDKDTVRQ